MFRSLFLFFQPECDFSDERVCRHVHDWYYHFLSCFDDWLEFGHQCVSDKSPVDAFFFDEFFGKCFC